MTAKQSETAKNVTAHTITPAQISALRAEAATAGDGEQVDVCDLALQSLRNGTAEAGERRFLRMCADAINAAQAMQD